MSGLVERRPASRRGFRDGCCQPTASHRLCRQLNLNCVTRVRPVEWGAIVWRAFRCNVAVGLVGRVCALHVVCRGPSVCRLSCGRSVTVRRVRVESTLLKLRVRTSR